jgi:hypothetical protein
MREIVEHREELLSEAGQELGRHHVLAWVAIVIANPFPEAYETNLVDMANELGPEIGALVGPRCVKLLDDEVEAFGKAALVGMGGEVEHGSALIHNLMFGNVFRDAARGTELLPAAEKVVLPGQSIDVPLKHKLDSKIRSHHQTATISIPGAPRDREIVIACLAANMGRPLARLAAFGAETAH